MAYRVLMGTRVLPIVAVISAILTLALPTKGHADEVPRETFTTANVLRSSLQPEYRDGLAGYGLTGDALFIQQGNSKSRPK